VKVTLLSVHLGLNMLLKYDLHVESNTLKQCPRLLVKLYHLIWIVGTSMVNKEL
jgi:hypothetical protein